MEKPPEIGAVESELEINRHRIVVVDDQPDLAGLLGMVLAAPGREVTVEHNVAGCLRAATEGKVAVLLLDLNLPDGTAFDLVPKLREMPGTAQTPILLLSGAPLYDWEEKRMSHLGVEVHLKPVRMNLLKARVEALLAGAGIPGS